MGGTDVVSVCLFRVYDVFLRNGMYAASFRYSHSVRLWEAYRILSDEALGDSTSQP